jgi:hypothetical protein
MTEEIHRQVARCDEHTLAVQGQDLLDRAPGGRIDPH